jgi:hypothetical protein
MDFVEIKNLARTFKAEDDQALIQQVFKLKQQGVGLLGLIYFVQMNQRLPLSEAKTKTLNFSFWRAEERLGVEESYQTIMHDFKGHSFNERGFNEHNFIEHNFIKQDELQHYRTVLYYSEHHFFRFSDECAMS